ncbi:hypothetical protein AB9F38_35965, partial [Rhizobium leguminosarum]
LRETLCPGRCDVRLRQFIEHVGAHVAAVEFGQDVGGLFSPEYENASWRFAKMVDLFSHLWLPVIILAVSSTASLIRVMR